MSADAPERLLSAEAAIRRVVSLDDLGLRVREIPGQQSIAVEAAAGLIDDTTAEAVAETARSSALDPQPVLTYLVNEMRHGDRVTPYSLVTAVDLSVVSDDEPEPFGESGDSVVVLNEWTAEDLDVEVGSTLELEYFVWEDEGRLSTRTTEAQVADIVPVSGAAADPTLAPDYPGITEANNLIEWDPPFEIDLGLIRPKDEDYWDEYRTTPKAFVPLEMGQQLWESRWGSLTSIRMVLDGDLSAGAEQFRGDLRAAIDPLAIGFVAYPARTLALEASAGATDFGLYFVYFSFFLVVSALLLASLFFRLGVEQRLSEIGLLRATGFPPAAIWRVFSVEALLLSVVGSLVGMAAAVAYADLIMWGLRTWWVDAVGTTRLGLAVSPVALAAGAGGGVVSAFVSIALTLRSLASASPRSLLAGAVLASPAAAETHGSSRGTNTVIGLFVLGAGLVLLAALGLMSETAGFFGGGLVLLCGMLTLAWVWLHGRPRRRMSAPWSVSRVGFRNATSRPGRSVLCIALIASAAFTIVAVDAFHREGGEAGLDPRSGTGGYTLLADTLLPIAHDPSTASGRDALNLADLAQPGRPLEGVALTRFRLRPGEDASCLNLYQAKDPRILAPTDAFVAAGRFSFAETLAETDEESENPWQLLHREFDDGAIPAIADATSLTYALHLDVGDDFILNRDTDNPITLRIVAALSDSIFQRELLIAEDQFERVFPFYDGYRFFLVDSQPDRTGEVSAALEDRLADFGFDAVAAGDRLAEFHRVENTYLATFQTLGGLGLILGTLGLGAVLLRNVLERRQEIALLRAVGFGAGHLSLMVLSENAFLLFAGLFAGTVSALVAIAPAWIARGGGLPIASLAALLAAVVTAGLLASLAATVAAVRSPLLRSLRTE
jgi:ABC-type lipoprotein release transport system permease subunit